MLKDASANPTGCKLHLMQFKLLLKKNWNVKRRNRQSTLMQFLVPFIVNFALFIISVDDKYNPNGFNARTWSTTQPDVTTVGGLPTCPLCKAVPIEVPAPDLPPAPRTLLTGPVRQVGPNVVV